MALLNAFGEVASESTLAELKDTIEKRSSGSGDAMLISGNKIRYRRDFIDPALTSYDLVTGDGMVVTAGTGSLAVTTGTTPNSVTTLTTKQTFTAPFKAAFGFKISQKIANQEFYVEAVAVNEDGTLDESVVAAWRVAGSDLVTTTNSRVEVRNGGPARTQSANITTSSQIVDSIFEIIIESSQVQFHSRLADSTAARSGSTVRNTVAPDPNRKFALRYRIVNGSVAPASTTTFTSQFLTAVDYTEIQAEITGGPGATNPSAALPVVVTSGAMTMTSTTLASSASVVGVTPLKVNTAATTNATLVKATAGRIYGYRFTNTHATAMRYVKFTNLTTLPVAGTSAVFWMVAIPPMSSIASEFTIPVSHSVGIGYTIVNGPADNDAVAVGLSEVVGHILFI